MVVVTAGSMSRLYIMHGLGSCRGMISFKTKFAQPNAFAKAHSNEYERGFFNSKMEEVWNSCCRRIIQSTLDRGMCAYNLDLDDSPCRSRQRL